MTESILNIWRELPTFLRVPLEFGFWFILMRGIIAKDITSWLEDRGVVKRKEESLIYRGLDGMYRFIKELVPNTNRKTAIWDHYAQGHPGMPAVDCNQGHCEIL